MGIFGLICLLLGSVGLIGTAMRNMQVETKASELAAIEQLRRTQEAELRLVRARSANVEALLNSRIERLQLERDQFMNLYYELEAEQYNKVEANNEPFVKPMDRELDV